MDIRNAKVLITGGSQGIGLETARLLVEKGARVLICGRNWDKLEKASKESGAIPLVCDVSQAEDLKKLIGQTLEKLGGLNVLVNNAGYGYFSLLEHLDAEKFRQLLETNLIGAAMVAKEASAHFIKQQYGNIINIASTAAKSGFPSGSAYCASKFGLTALTECWRAELRQYNIRVMQINPSEVQTQFVINSGREARAFNETKLQSIEIAHCVSSMLEMEDRGFITDMTVFATNPKV